VQSYQIDKKVDDGYPRPAALRDMEFRHAGGECRQRPLCNGVCYGSLLLPAVRFNLNVYALTQNGGAGANCALSFRFSERGMGKRPPERIASGSGTSAHAPAPA